jgi:hypothetical protein
VKRTEGHGQGLARPSLLSQSCQHKCVGRVVFSSRDCIHPCDTRCYYVRDIMEEAVELCANWAKPMSLRTVYPVGVSHGSERALIGSHTFRYFAMRKTREQYDYCRTDDHAAYIKKNGRQIFQDTTSSLSVCFLYAPCSWHSTPLLMPKVVKLREDPTPE